jgi:hypothetical protein
MDCAAASPISSTILDSMEFLFDCGERRGERRQEGGEAEG